MSGVASCGTIAAGLRSLDLISWMYYYSASAREQSAQVRLFVRKGFSPLSHEVHRRCLVAYEGCMPHFMTRVGAILYSSSPPITTTVRLYFWY